VLLLLLKIRRFALLLLMLLLMLLLKWGLFGMRFMMIEGFDVKAVVVVIINISNIIKTFGVSGFESRRVTMTRPVHAFDIIHNDVRVHEGIVAMGFILVILVLVGGAHGGGGNK
jgi:hypothetical protein